MSWWSEPDKALLKLLWPTKTTAEAIGRQLPDVKREKSAVIAQARRMALGAKAYRNLKPAKPKAPKQNFKVHRKELVKQAAITQAIDNPAPPMLVDECSRVEPPGFATVQTLGAGMCKWPIGDPRADDFTFCGRRATDGVYCPSHNTAATGTIKPPTNPPSRSRVYNRSRR